MFLAMDMHAPAPPLDATEALRRLVAQVVSGGDAVLEGDAAAVLDWVGAVLRRRRCRVLRASAAGPGGLGLSGLMAQVTGQPDLAAQDDGSLQRGAQALTRLDDGCDAIVLLLDGAAALQRPALRYLQLACTSSPDLRLVLGGLPDGLDGAEFAALRTRLATCPALVVAEAGATEARSLSPPERPARVLPAVPAAPLFPPSVTPQQAAPAAKRAAAAAMSRTRPAWMRPAWMRPAWAGLGMAACLVAGVLIGWATLGSAVQPSAMVGAEAGPASSSQPAASALRSDLPGQPPQPSADQPGTDRSEPVPPPVQTHADEPWPARAGEAQGTPPAQAAAAPADALGSPPRLHAQRTPRAAWPRSRDPRPRDLGADQRLAADVRAAWARRRVPMPFEYVPASRPYGVMSGGTWADPYVPGPYAAPSWLRAYPERERIGPDPYVGYSSRAYPYGP